jgi:hypothetical protein
MILYAADGRDITSNGVIFGFWRFRDLIVVERLKRKKAGTMRVPAWVDENGLELEAVLDAYQKDETTSVISS